MLFGNQNSLQLINPYLPRINSRQERPVMTPVQMQQQQLQSYQQPQIQNSQIKLQNNFSLRRFDDVDRLLKENPFSNVKPRNIQSNLLDKNYQPIQDISPRPMNIKVNSRQAVRSPALSDMAKKASFEQNREIFPPPMSVGRGQDPARDFSRQIQAQKKILSRQSSHHSVNNPNQTIFSNPYKNDPFSKPSNEVMSNFGGGGGGGSQARSINPFVGYNHNFIMGPRQPRQQKKALHQNNQSNPGVGGGGNFQEQLILSLVQGLQNQRQTDTKRKNEELMERIQKLQRSKNQNKEPIGFMRVSQSQQKLQKLLPKLEKITNAFQNPSSNKNPWLVNSQLPIQQQPNGFAQPIPQLAQRGPIQYIRDPAPTQKKVKYRASTPPPPPDDSDEQLNLKREKKKLKKKVNQNQNQRQKLLKAYKLPEDNESEEDQQFKQKLRDIDQTGKAKKQHDMQRKNYFDERIQQVEDKGTKANRKGVIKAVFQSATRILLLFFRASKRVRQNKLKNQSLIADGLKIYTQVLKNKFIQWFKVPLTSILSDKKINFNLKGNDGILGTSKKTLENRFVQLKVRVRSIMNILFENTTTFSISKPILGFLSNLIKEGAFIPQNFFTQYQKKNLQFNNDGGLKYVDDAQAYLLLASFMITKVLIRHIFLRPQESGINMKNKQSTKKNFKVLGSVLYYALFSAVSQMMPGRKSEKDIYEDGLYEELVPVSQLIIVFQEHSQWVFSLKKDFQQWIQRVLTVVRTHEEEEKKIRESINAPNEGQVY